MKKSWLDRKGKRGAFCIDSRDERNGAVKLALRRSACQMRSALLRLMGRGLLAFLAVPGWAQNQASQPDLANLDLELLMNLEVTSASKREQKLFQTAAAIFAITQEDIRRSGATDIPDLLRMVPGLQVSQINAWTWAIASRGFAERFANKLLVLVDGRSVYSPLFSGVFWDLQNVMVEDIERIEVIRGPGATLWGANAVNGVINIITRHSRDTQGGLVATTVGSEERIHSNVRYGGKFNSSASYRLYASYFNRQPTTGLSGSEAHDQWEATQGGFRTDWNISPRDSLTVQGDVNGRWADDDVSVPSLTAPYQNTNLGRGRFMAGDLLARWDRLLARGDDLTFQVYYDRNDRDDPSFQEQRNTFDFELKHHRVVGRRQDWIWGGGYRVTSMDSRGNFRFSIEPPEDTDHLVNAFVQDEVSLLPSQLRVVLGSKFEHSEEGGFLFQPNVRLLWTPNNRHTLWGAISRAARRPSEVDANAVIRPAAFPGPRGVPTLLTVFGNDEIEAENLQAYEIGYRVEASQRVSFDLATFFNVYDHLRTLETGTPFFETTPPPAHLVLPQRFVNGMDGETYGLELVANWRVLSRWSLSAGYSWLQMQLHRHPSIRDSAVELDEGYHPEHQFNVRSTIVLPRRLEWDTSLYAVSSLPNLSVPRYARLDTGFSWRPAELIGITVGAQNLLSPRHVEFGNVRQSGEIGQAERNFFTKITWRF